MLEVLRLFGLNLVSPPLFLPSYEDNNYLVTTESGKFVLKKYRLGTSEEYIKFQNLVIQTLHDNNTSVQEVFKSPNGNSIEKTAAGNLVILISYLQGVPFGDVFKEAKPDLFRLGYLERIGHELAVMDATLSKIEHPEAHRKFEWDLRYTDELAPKLEVIKTKTTPERHALATFYVDLFNEYKERLESLPRKQIIHGDPNDYNLILDDNNYSVGFIDFGDLVHTFAVCDVAICLAYLCIYFEDPLNAILPTLKSYHKHYSLSLEELEVLFPLLCARLAMSVIQSTYHASPDNPYVAISQTKAWDALTFFRKNVTAAHAYEVFRNTVGL